MILEPKKIKSVPVSIDSPSICHEVMGLDAISYFIYIYIFSFFLAEGISGILNSWK